ncbi:MAG: carbohydrate binding domain-containing protein [Saprospiraceae bacterium]|nr:carbohydrate binding domain-containing protein [Saprospiraceae bacterium]
MKYYLKKPQPLQQKLFFMLLWFTASFGLQAQVCEPISNGGFETNSGTNDFAGWNYYNGALNFSISNDMVHGGTSSMQAANPGTANTYSLQVLAPAFPTVVGQQYTFKIWIKALNNNTTTIQFSRRDGSGNNENGYMTTGTISNQWTELSYVFTAQYSSTRITLNLGGTTANTYHLDDACVISPTVAPQACTPLANGNFESVSAPNMFTGWSYLNGMDNFPFHMTWYTEVQVR